MDREMWVLIKVKFPVKAKAPMEFLKGLEEDLDAMAKAVIIEDYQLSVEGSGPILIYMDEEIESAD